MPDNISLSFGGRKITEFSEYSVDSDLYTAGDAFSVTLPDPAFAVNPGQQFQLFVNDRLEMTGIIDRVSEYNGKDGSRVVVEGRDLLGLVVDSYCEEFITLEGVTLKAERLLRAVPFINRKNIEYQAGIAGATASKTGDNDLFDLSQDLAQIEPGQTVFEVLRDFAESRGAMFFSLPDGTFVFGRPKAKGKPLFTITRRLDGAGNNVMDGSRVRDISQQYSKIIVVGQKQGADGIEAADLNTIAIAQVDDVPFYKPFVEINNNDLASPANAGRVIAERQRAMGLQLSYTTPGHSVNGRNWAVNELCAVLDEKFEINGTYLIYGRTFRIDKSRGPVTELRLGLPGVIR